MQSWWHSTATETCYLAGTFQHKVHRAHTTSPLGSLKHMVASGSKSDIRCRCKNQAAVRQSAPVYEAEPDRKQQLLSLRTAAEGKALDASEGYSQASVLHTGAQ